MKKLIEKLRLRDESIILNAPLYLAPEFAEIQYKDQFNKNETSKSTLAFFYNSDELHKFLTGRLGNIEPDSVLWFAYPKGTSKIKTDINRDIIRLKSEEYGITTVTAIAVDETWSALRFRPADRVGK